MYYVKKYNPSQKKNCLLGPYTLVRQIKTERNGIETNFALTLDRGNRKQIYVFLVRL